MKLLITGGAGYIGSNLLSALSDRYEVICLDHGRLFSEFREIIGDNIRLVKGDLIDENLLVELMPEVNTIIHLAGGGGNDRCMRNPAEAVMTHVYGTHLLLKTAVQYNVRRIIFASTISVYGTYKKRKVPLTEDMELRPDDLYGALKAAAEYEIRDSKFNYIILRLANVYGYGNGLHGAQSGGAINNFVRATCSGSDIKIFGTGKQQIDYVYVNDVCRCVNLILENPAIRNKIFNIGSQRLYSIENIANIVLKKCEEVSGFRGSLTKVMAPESKVWPDRLMSTENIRRQLDWMPRVSLEEGIYEMIKGNWKSP